MYRIVWCLAYLLLRWNMTTSPTMELIMDGPHGPPCKRTSENGPSNLTTDEVEWLLNECAMLRRKLAQLTAQYIWVEGGSFAKINQEIRQYGFRLVSMNNGHDPRIVPLGNG